MNAYKLKNSEVMKMNNEFTKTGFGFRAKLFSMIPLFIGVCFIFAGSIFFSQDENGIIAMLCILGFAISLIGLCITQLQYGNMLKDYINSKDKN